MDALTSVVAPDLQVGDSTQDEYAFVFSKKQYNR